MQIIQLQGDENIAVIRNLVEQAAEKDVLLYVPRGCEALERNRVNLTVLRRWADSLALCLGVVFEDRETRGLAREVGLLVLPSASYAQRVDLQRLDRRRRRRQMLPPRPVVSVFAPRDVDSEFIPHRRRTARGAVAGLAAALVALAAVAGLLLFIVPSATITLRPASEPVSASMEIVAVADLAEIDYGKGYVPARTISFEQVITDTITTTDRRDVPDGYAQGTVIFANKNTIPVTITRGTLVRTSSGDTVRFYTVADAALPGQLYGTVRVGVLAAEPGPRGNVAALSINVIEGELAAQADVLNDARLAGGSLRRMGVVAGQDKVTLRAKTLKRLQEEAYGELTAALSSTEFIPPDSLEITVLQEKFNYGVGDMSDELSVMMQVQVSGLAINTAPGEDLLVRLLEQRTKAGYQLVDGSTEFTREGLISATPEEARFAMSVRAAIAPLIEVDSVSHAVTGKTVEAAKEYLTRQIKLSSEPDIELSNGLLKRLPWWAARIQVQVSAG
jgi:hypothetical protein